MSDIASVAKLIQVEEIEDSKPCSESMLQKIGGSINYILDQLEGEAVGSIVSSMKDETAFQTAKGAGWVLADGRSVTGSRYANITGNNTIPDLRGLFLRHGNYDSGVNPDGNQSPGYYQTDTIASHKHNSTINNPYSFMSLKKFPADTGWPYQTTEEGIDEEWNILNFEMNMTLQIANQGVSQGNPINTTINWFVRIN